jgi:hypothetical protein
LQHHRHRAQQTPSLPWPPGHQLALPFEPTTHAQRLEHALGHSRVKMALDSLGYRYGHTIVWQLVALYTQAHPPAQPEKCLPNPGERPQQAMAPHQVWFVDVRCRVHA